MGKNDLRERASSRPPKQYPRMGIAFCMDWNSVSGLFWARQTRINWVLILTSSACNILRDDCLALESEDTLA